MPLHAFQDRSWRHASMGPSSKPVGAGLQRAAVLPVQKCLGQAAQQQAHEVETLDGGVHRRVRRDAGIATVQSKEASHTDRHPVFSPRNTSP
jgi:hypothetical protein